MSAALIDHICDLAQPQRRDRYARYLATLGEAELKQKLADLLLDRTKAHTEPVRFWQPTIRNSRMVETAVDRRELITI